MLLLLYLYQEVGNMNPFESGKCPVCQTKLHIGKLTCPECHAQFPMDEPLNAFTYLSTSQANFLEIFLKNRGNLKAVGEEMNCSYPTVSKYLTDILIALGYASENTIKKEEESMDIQQIKKSPTDTAKASHIIRNKMIEAGGRIVVHSYKGIPYELSLTGGGEKFYCPQLIPYSFSIFDDMVDVMLKNGGKAKKGSGRKKLGDPGCEENTIAGAILKNYYKVKPGGSGLDPAFVLIPVLEWAGIAKNEWGYVQLTSAYLSLRKQKQG